MKKISLLIAALLGMAAFSSCVETKDDHPVLKPVTEGTEDFLNTPVMTNATLDLTRDNESDYVHLTCSQPEAYGFAAPVRYAVQVSFDKAFTDYLQLGTTFTDCSEINPINGEIAEAICKLKGIQDASQVPTPYQPLYFRLMAELVGATGSPTPESAVLSNVVAIDEVSCNYLAIIVPGLPSGIYVRGSINEWNALPEYELVTTSERDSYIFKGITLAEGDSWKLADADWGTINLGLKSSDVKVTVNTAIELADKGANIDMDFNFEGNILLQKTGNKYMLTLQSAGAPSGIYFRGDMNGWGAERNWEFTTTDEDNVYTLKNITISTDQGFKVADKDWGAINYGGDSPVIPGKEYTLKYNGGNLNVSADFTGNAVITKTDEKDEEGNAVYTLLLSPAQ